MNKKYLLQLICIATSLFCFSSCIKDDIPGSEEDAFQKPADENVIPADYNANLLAEIPQEIFMNAFTEMDVKMGLIQEAQLSIHDVHATPHAYQVQFSTLIDNYAGYFVAPQDFSGRLVSTSYLCNQFRDGPYGCFLNVKNNVTPLLYDSRTNALPEFRAMCLVIYSLAAQEVTDIYGSIPYNDFKHNVESHPFTYMKGMAIYDSIVVDLDKSIAVFEHFNMRPDWHKTAINTILAKQDKLLDGTIESWKRLANSLKLRMALHIVEVDPIKAKKWAEEAVASGVIEAGNREAYVDPGKEFSAQHPLFFIARLWKDTRLNASFESIMESLNLPTKEVLFTTNKGKIYDHEGHLALNDEEDLEDFDNPTNPRMVGIRAGVPMKPRSDDNTYLNYSYLGDKFSSECVYLFRMSECYFLRAEGALRGWNMQGTAQDLYEQGILKGYVAPSYYSNRWEQRYAKRYMSLTKANDYTYVDPHNSRWNHESVTKIGVKWDDTASKEIKLEQIITQKWVFNFPNSIESWTELRRTGFPMTFPILFVTDGDGSLSDGDMIRRIPFAAVQDAEKADVLSTGIPSLGGPNTQATRLFWDTDAPAI
ncbi:MAG: SusD/RagB family nutrient-binding outer membrane lipoprotein [Bacteroidaceae bacterium]